MQAINDRRKIETFYHLISASYFIIYVDGNDEIETLFFNISQRCVDELLEGKFFYAN